jgi:hypothetical protein
MPTFTRTYQPSEATERRTVHVIEQDLSDLANAFETIPAHELNKRYAECATPEHNLKAGYVKPAWYGGLSTLAEVKSLLDTGWGKGADKVRKLADELAAEIPAAQSRRRKPRWADDGHTLDVDRALAGQWDSAYRTSRREVTSGTSIVDVLVGWGGNAGCSADELFWSGASMLVICDLLESAGYAVRLIATSCVSQYEYGLKVHKVTVKDSGEPLRIDALAGTLCHAGVYRTYGFQGILSAPFRTDNGLGQSCSMERAEAILSQIGESMQTPGALVMPHAYSRQGALENIRSALKTLQPNS